MKKETIQKIVNINNKTIKNYIEQLKLINLPQDRRNSLLSKIGTLNVENQTLQNYLN